MMTTRRSLFAATAAMLLLLTALQAWSLWRAPPAWMPAAIALRLSPGEALTLGSHELAAPQAERAHVTVRRDAQGKWLLLNLSATRAPLINGADGERRMGSAAPAAPYPFQVGAAVFDVTVADGRSLDFKYGAEHWRYDGATLYRDGSAQAPCADSRLATRLAALWNGIAPPVLTVARALSFGGNVHCGNRLGVPGLAPGVVTISRINGRLLLAPGGQDDGHAALRLGGAGGWLDLRREERALADISSFIAGRTRYQVNLQGSVLTLTPSRHVSLFGAPDVRLAPQITWQWQQRALWQIQSGGGAWIALAALAVLTSVLAGALACRQADVRSLGAVEARSLGETGARPFGTTGVRSLGKTGARPFGASGIRALGTAGFRFLAAAGFRSRGTAGIRPASAAKTWPSGAARTWRAAGMPLAAAVLLGAGLAALSMQRAGHAPGAACSLLLGSAALALWLILPARLSLLGGAALVLLAAGLLAQLELGLGAHESSWLRYYQKNAALLAIGSGTGALWHCWALARRALTHQRTIEWLLALLALISLAALAAQVLWGDETGVFDLQPVELAKLALTALSAHCLALRLGWHDGSHRQAGHGMRWLQLLAPALLFLALLGLALVQVDDYSPLILLLVWSCAMAFAYAIAARNRALAATMAGVALAAVGAIALVRGAGADSLAQWPLTGAFYADRFQVWLAPAMHPHTGQQLLLGARAIADGGWWGADSLLGLRSLGQSAGSAVSIPAVQDDFAPAFFLNRHGLLGALLLWMAQAGFVIGVLQLAAQAHGAAGAARDFRHAWLGRFRYFAMCGGAAFVAGHLLLSWGTNLAIFPIMGQPMSFLSAGGSHLLFFLCPLLAFCAVSAQSLEENLPCRSTSNTPS
ncbi:MAG: FtsW/RodA/SpoVE family cell cycle protein [Pseudomonadota bacterium]